MNDQTAAMSSEERPPARISPWWIILGGGMAAMLVFGAFAGLAIALREEPPPKMGIASATMPDGTLLVLEAVTYGTHSFDVEMPPMPGFTFFPTQRTETISAYGSTNGYALWFSRRDAGRPDRYLDFEWWSRCVAVDANGFEVKDDDPGLRGFGNGGSTGTGGSRPLSVNASGTRYERVIAHSSLPRVRHTGETFKLRVYNFNDEIVAEFDVRDPAPAASIPDWKPAELPARVDDGDLTLQLNNVTAQVHSWSSSRGVEENVQINFATDFFENGEPTENWFVSSTQLADALGNRSDTYGCTLSPFEPAWKVNIRAYRTSSAPFAESETWSATPLPLPAADTGVLVSESATVGSSAATVSVIAIGGGGAIEYSGLGASGTNSGYGGSAGDAPFQIDHDSPYSYTGAPSVSTTKVDCKRPHLVLRVEGLSANQNLTLMVADDQGRDVKTHGPYQVDDMWFFFLEPADDATNVTPQVIVQDGRNFELLIKPPEIIRPSKRLPESAVLQRVAQVSQSPLLYTSYRTDNGELMLAEPGATQLRNLTNNSSKDCGAAWSPDGSQIVFESERNGQHNLWILNADGSGVRQLTMSTEPDYAPAWSPQGDRICFRRITSDPNQNWELFVIHPDGTGETNITNHPSNDADPAWSPDGSRIAFTSSREQAWWLYSMNPDGTDVQLLSRTSNGYVYPAWSPDGSQIAFTGGVDRHHEIFVIGADGQNERQVTDLKGESSHAAWTPDGSLITFDHRKGNYPWGQGSIFVVRPDGSGLEELIPIEALVDGGRPAWKPR